MPTPPECQWGLGAHPEKGSELCHGQRQLLAETVSVNEGHGGCLQWMAKGRLGHLEDIEAVQALKLQRKV